MSNQFSTTEMFIKNIDHQNVKSDFRTSKSTIEISTTKTFDQLFGISKIVNRVRGVRAGASDFGTCSFLVKVIPQGVDDAREYAL